MARNEIQTIFQRLDDRRYIDVIWDEELRKKFIRLFENRIPRENSNVCAYQGMDAAFDILEGMSPEENDYEKELKRDIKNLNTRVENLKKNSNEKTNKINVLICEKKSIGEENEKFQTTINSLKDENKSLQEENEKLQKALDSIMEIGKGVKRKRNEFEPSSNESNTKVCTEIN